MACFYQTEINKYLTMHELKQSAAVMQLPTDGESIVYRVAPNGAFLRGIYEGEHFRSQNPINQQQEAYRPDEVLGWCYNVNWNQHSAALSPGNAIPLGHENGADGDANKSN
jgi:hypothetical protein